MEATLVYPHQLFSSHPALSRNRQVFIIEDPLFFLDHEFPLKFHKQKIVLHHLSINNYYNKLKKENYDVKVISYKSLIDKEFLKTFFIDNSINKIFYADLHDYELNKRLSQITKDLKIKSVVCQSPSFLLDNDQVEDDFKGKNKFMMAQFYQKQRKRFNILIDSNQKPIGGKWSFDAENRKRLPKNLKIPPINPIINKAQLTNELKHLINLNFSSNPGKIDNFNYAVSHEQAKISFDHFLIERFKYFGDYEDAISINEPYIFHSLLTPALNIGLITPKQILNSTLEYSKEFNVPLNSLEGFVRQIIGWREFIRAVYHLKGSKQRTTNFWNFSKKIPNTFYNGSTGIIPVDNIIKNINKNGYAHHIERLMVLGNIMCLMRFDPNEVYKWFMEMFIDSYDWVMVPNVYGMSQFADGGIMSTKPYISGSNYILKMSNYKKEAWCELWDALYWRFIDDHRDFFNKNYRMKMMVTLYDKKEEKIKKNYVKLYDDI